MNKQEMIHQMMRENSVEPIAVWLRSVIYSLDLGGGIALWLMYSNPDWMRFFGILMAVIGVLSFAKMRKEVKKYAKK